MQSNWQKNLYHQEIAPPQGAWEKIARDLDNASPAESIYNLEEMPPGDSWAAISDALDQEDKTAWASNIYQQETLPPAEIWSSISQQLDSETSAAAKSATIPVRSGKWYRAVAAAAVVTGVLITSIWLFNRTPQHQAEIASVSPAPQQQQASTKPIPEQIKGSIKSTGETSPVSAAAVTTVHQFPETEPAETESVTVPSVKPLAYATNTPVAIEEDKAEASLYNRRKLENPDSDPITGMDNTVTVANGNYISISGPDGQSVKLSSKFSNLVSYLNDTAPQNEELLDKIIRESAFWKTRFRKWREKMLNNTSAPAFTNFLDVVELGKLLEEKE